MGFQVTKKFHDLHFSGFYNHYIPGDGSESIVPCFDQLLYLIKLLNRWHAHECVCRRMNTDLNVVELGESNLCVLILLFFVTSLIKWLTWGRILAVGSRGGTLDVRDWGLQ